MDQFLAPAGRLCRHLCLLVGSLGYCVGGITQNVLNQFAQKLAGGMGRAPGEGPLTFGMDPVKGADQGNFFFKPLSLTFPNITLLSAILVVYLFVMF